VTARIGAQDYPPACTADADAYLTAAPASPGKWQATR
jgi:hypothetical protein